MMMMRIGLLGPNGVGESSNRNEMKEFWKQLWSLPVAGKIKHFLWKCCYNVIPVQDNLKHRGVRAISGCSLCGCPEETVIHLAAHCPFARAVWFSSPMQIDSQALEGCSFINWWSELIRRGQGYHDEVIWKANAAYLLWGIWKSRNRVLFNHACVDPVWVMQHAVGQASEFLKANKERSLERSSMNADRVVKQTHWGLPPPGLVKINFDGAFVQSLNIGGVGVVARSDDGSFLCARACGSLRARSAVVMESFALRAGILLAKERGFRRVIFEGDAKALIEVLNGKSAGCEDIQLLVLDILQLCRSSFDVFSFVFAGRTCNAVAHEFAKKGCNVGNCLTWIAIPLCGCGILSVERNCRVPDFFR
ncbi:hypothetical protein Vadar_000030 [Vaccinium darrowii]|uniref:Uncharacterized protein n=1 Tax=Vaccinium darrowii TaxID=229202 RepID=A0ACB7WWC1_9ERIC|nr:hypothetical protein Vadar_000030 [Vaccinium darrowii]